MTEDRIQLGDLAIRPSFDRVLKPIHPAIGAVDDTAYVGVWIPCKVESVDKQGNSKVVEKDLLFLVTDKREKILANDEILSSRGWRLAYKPIRFEDRWLLEDVKRCLTECSDSLEPIQVFEHILEVYHQFIELPNPEEYVYEALWTIGTYFHHLFNSFPYRYVGGVKRCGKTKNLTLHSCLDFNAIFSNNMSVASIFRLIQNARSTLLIDETEKLRNPDRAQEFRSILLAGYKQGAKVYRVEKNSKEKLVPESFEVYSPKILANISGIEDVLEDRCKVTFLRRSINRAIVDREINISSQKWSELRYELYRLYLGFWREIRANYDRLNEQDEHNELMNILKGLVPELKDDDLQLLTARELELWKPILALAMFLDSKSKGLLSKFTSSSCSLCSWMLKLAIEDAGQKQVENLAETGELILVEVLHGIVSKPDYKDDYVYVKDIKASMVERFEEEQKWLTTRWIGKALRHLGFKEKERRGAGYRYKLPKAMVLDLALRMQIKASSEGTLQTLPTQPTPEASGKLPCEVCNSFNAKMHLIPNKGVRWLCDKCLENYPEKV